MSYKISDNHWQGFTLIELLVVISIIAILVTLSILGLQGAREASRDSKRKSDLELIRSGLEMYRSDCNRYPNPVSNQIPSPLIGSGTPTSCATTNTYIAEAPLDPNSPARFYRYSISGDGSSYQLCASLEGGEGSVTCGTNICGTICNYRVVSP